MFQEQCMKANEAKKPGEPTVPVPDAPLVSVPQKKKGPASSLKSEVYAAVRDAVRYIVPSIATVEVLSDSLSL